MSSEVDSNQAKPQLEVDDEEKTSQTETIQRIQSFRDDIYEFKVFLAKNEISDEVSQREQLRSYHQLVMSFLKMLKPYLTDERVQTNTDYWEDVDIGTFTVEPPDVIQRPSRREISRSMSAGPMSNRSLPAPQNNPQTRRYSVTGLKDFEQAPPEWDEEWTVMYGPDVSPHELLSEIESQNVDIKQRAHRNEPITVVKRQRLPQQVIDNAVCQLEAFLREVGMDVEMKAPPYMGEGGPGL